MGSDDRLAEMTAIMSRVARVGGFEVSQTRQVRITDQAHELLEIPVRKETYALDDLRQLGSEAADHIVNHAVEAALSQGIPFDVEGETRTFAGNRIWLRAIGVPVVEGGKVVRVAGALQDISDRKRDEASLRAQQARLQSVFSAVADGIAVFDDRGAIESANPTFLRIFELGAQAVTELDAEPDLGDVRLSSLLPGIDLIAIAKQASAETTATSQRTEAVTHCGRRFPVETSVRRVTLEGAERYVAVVRDRTQAAQLEAQLLQAQKLESIGRLAGGVAHDFNNLLTGVLGYASMLERSLEPTDPNRDDVKEIRQAAQRARQLTGQLLSFARRDVASPRPLDLGQIVATVSRLLTRVLGNDIRLVTVLEADGACVYLDPSQAEQLVMNLAVNARDAMPEGGSLRIFVSKLDVDVTHQQRHEDARLGPHLLLEVSDSGHGIPEDALPFVFEPFFTTKPPGIGTGLGLSTCYGIVKQAGGHLALESVPNRGTTVRVYLPEVPHSERQAEKKSARPQRNTPPRTPEPVLRGLETVLISEDDQRVRRYVQRVLAEFGYDVLTAPSGLLALEAARAHHNPPHLLLTDVVMDGMSGVDLAVRLVERLPDLRVLFMSGHPGEHLPHLSALAAPHAFIQKPFEPDALAKAVRTLLDRK